MVYLDADALIGRLEEAARRLVRDRTEVEEVYLVGSLARGDHNGLSDADVLLVLRETDMNPVQRTMEYLPYFDLPVGVDVLPYTRRELEVMNTQGFPPALSWKKEARRLA